LTLGAPLGAMPKFAPNEVFPKVSEVISASMRDKLPLGEIRSEIERQLDRFEAVMDRPPDFVDGHQHVQCLPDIRDELLDALSDRRLVGKCWLRDSSDHLHRILARRAFAKKALVLRGLGRGFRKRARKAGFAVNDGFAGFSDFHPGKDYAEQFETYLRALGPRHLIMCHPGHVDEDLRALDPVTVTREQELAFLLSDRFSELLARKGVTLARLCAAVSFDVFRSPPSKFPVVGRQAHDEEI
jgi:predicted glycoside hydrolase/deacetylase ChbG (UPF0249 family)